MRFGRLVAIEPSGKDNHGGYVWRCICDCGKETDVRLSDLTQGKTKSCGCLHFETLSNGANKKHGMKQTRLYRIWRGIKTRCGNRNTPYFKNYGERGISVYEPWRDDFFVFANWALNNGYAKGLEIDRINNDDGYYPWNCRFVTRTENSNNKRTNHTVTCRGETHTLAEWSKISGVQDYTIRQRLSRGWNEEKAIFTNTQNMKKG